MSEATNVLYRFFDGSGALLYVGITISPPSRLRSHQAGKDWWSAVRRIDLEPHVDRDAVESAERHAIRTEKPKYNVQHTLAAIPRGPGSPCDIDGCEKFATSRMLCHKHYMRWRKYGDPLFTLRRGSTPGATCSIDGCESTATSRGWCGRHYNSWYRYGDPLAARSRSQQDWREASA